MSDLPSNYQLRGHRLVRTRSKAPRASSSSGSLGWLPTLFWLLSAVPLRGQGDAAERFAGAGRANRDERVEVTVRCRLGGTDAIGDFDQFVGIGAVVAV